MAENTPKESFELTGAEDVPATYTDIFAVATEAETGMSTIYFFQRHPDAQIFSGSQGTVEDATRKGRCVARMLLSSKGVDALLQALAQNQGFTLTPNVGGQE
jgi:hypothetical protein